MSTKKHISSFDQQQSTLNLTAIQVTGATSLPVLNIGIQLAHKYELLTSFLILLFGNVLVWTLAFVMIQMTAHTKKNTLDNVRDYLGSIGSWAVGIMLLISTIAYYVTQTNLTTETIISLLPFNEGYNIDKFFQIGVILGIASVLAIIQGMNGLRWLATTLFPIIMLVFVGLVLFLPTSSHMNSTMPIPFAMLPLALGTSFSIAVDYPTFFQHSKSKKNSILAITSIQLITTIIGVGGLYLGKYVNLAENTFAFDLNIILNVFLKILLLIFIVFSCLCINTLNVYSASIAWELIAPDVLLGKKEYTILSLSLTAIFILTTGIISVDFLRTIADISLANLCLILVFGYLGKLITGPLLSQEKIIFFIFWIMSSIISVSISLSSNIKSYSLLIGWILSIALVTSFFILKKIRYLTAKKSAKTIARTRDQ